MLSQLYFRVSFFSGEGFVSEIWGKVYSRLCFLDPYGWGSTSILPLFNKQPEFRSNVAFCWFSAICCQVMVSIGPDACDVITLLEVSDRFSWDLYLRAADSRI